MTGHRQQSAGAPRRFDDTQIESLPPLLTRHKWTLLAVSLIAVELARQLYVGWWPHDEGVLALSASLVRHGSWPHRDFTDVYSGGPALLGAVAQRLFGDDLRSLRIPLFLGILTWTGVLIACLRRFVAPFPAAALAVVAFLWGPALYTAAMPTWYMLFAATALIWCQLRWIETGHLRWQFVAGLCIGCAIVFKINGLFLLAATGSIMLGDRAILPGANLGNERSGALIRTIGLTAAVAAIVGVVLNGWPWRAGQQLIVPIVALAIAAAVWNLHRRESLGALLRGPGRALGMALLGMAVVLAPPVLVYAADGSARALATGLLWLPFRRVSSAHTLPSYPSGAELLVLIMIGIASGPRFPKRQVKFAAAAVLMCGCLLAWSGFTGNQSSISEVWTFARLMLPFGLVAAAAIGLWQHGQPRSLLAVAWVTAWFACVQYPFAAPIYLSYVAPLAILVFAGIVGTMALPRPVPAAVGLAAVAVTLAVNQGQSLKYLGFDRESLPMARLALPHGGLIVPAADADEYEAILRVLDGWRAARILAAPDAPEVYYLTGRPMVGREFFEFTAPRWNAEVLAQRAIAGRVGAVVLKTRAQFSRVKINVVIDLLRSRILTDTTIGDFRLLHLSGSDASP